MLIGGNIKGTSKVVQRVCKRGLGVIVIRICIGTLCLVDISVLEAKVCEERSDLLSRVSPESA